MPSSGNDEQFKFLISCIRHANNSKVDFTEVAKECGIVSKGAAAKRYERMMKAHGINANGASVRSTPAPTSAKREPKESNKKRKLDQFASDNNGGAMDDDEGVARVKSEVPAERSLIKREASADDATPSTHDLKSSGNQAGCLDMVLSSVAQVDGADDGPRAYRHPAMASNSPAQTFRMAHDQDSDADNADIVLLGERLSVVPTPQESILISE